MKTLCVIPARLKSSRLKHKILQTIEGKSLVERSFLAASRSGFFDEVVVAVDDPLVAEHLKNLSIPFFMTNPACLSGTERLIELSQKGMIQADFYVNWQADEPFLAHGMLEDFFAGVKNSKADVVTLKRQVVDEARASCQNVVKVVTNHWGRALYFSRSRIPFCREGEPFKSQKIFEHVGLYGFFAPTLEKIATLPASFLEETEKLEQLKFLEYGLSIDVATTQFESIGIDTAEDLARARDHFKQSLAKPC